MKKAHEPVHPGEILLEEFLEPMGISQYRLAKDTTCHRGASMRSCTAGARLQRIRPCDCRATSEPPSVSG